MNEAAIQPFIDRWKTSGGAERANYQLFLTELCEVLGVEHPNPALDENQENSYVFEKAVKFHHGDGTESTGFIDLYKRGCFVLETKQGVEKEQGEKPLSSEFKARLAKRKRGTATRGTASWDDAMIKAKGQAENYARALPATEGRPPFLIVIDVGFSIELYSEFSQTGGNYVPFPDPANYRASLDRLKDERFCETLKKIWTDPLGLDPSRQTEKVTREIAGSLAKLAKSLESSGHEPEKVAHFLMRCLFTMFAEDMDFLRTNSFTELLESLRGNVSAYVPMVEELWEKMKAGGFSTALRHEILRFNGALFEDNEVLSLTDDQFELLIEASKADWRDVEPAIFGTLLERALDPIERHKLGAHYTPRVYVERLVLPTVVEPLREEWSAVQTAALALVNQDKEKEAIAEVETFHRRLCEIKVLDPACGSGNFLYVTLEHLKRIEGEVLNTLFDLTREAQASFDLYGMTVDPHQLLGLEVNPRAAAIAELVLWIGYLQWHRKTHGKSQPVEPIIKNFHNIECRDAVLEWDEKVPLLDEEGQPVTRWDGRTMKLSPVTGEEIPDETARVPVYKFLNPRKAEWPQSDFVVGNPPFIGTARMRESLGDGYTETLRKIHDEVSESSDYVMYWWNHAAHLAREGKIERFGFIATNSLKQTFNRRVLDNHLGAKVPLSLIEAIPDHPWVDSSDGAAVRISMTVAGKGEELGNLRAVVVEEKTEELGRKVLFEEKAGKIQSNLTIGPNVSGAAPLSSNENLSCRGVQLIGSGFIVTPEESASLGLGAVEGLSRRIRPYRNGRDLTQTPRNVMVIDLYGLEIHEVRSDFPEVYQWLEQRVKPERDQNNRPGYRKYWWIHGEPRGNFRPALKGLSRYIATVETSKHRFFVFLDDSILPDNMLVNIALEDAFFLGVLSSKIHVCWALKAGGRLGVGNDPRYNKTRCFEPFPFPDPTEEQKARIRELGEALDAHRKGRQERFPGLTMTNMYNVLEKLRDGEELTKKEREVHEQGLVSVLKQIHDDLDAAVFEAYGWSPDLSEEEILQNLVDLNAERAAEEKRGIVRWLRPEFQKPEETPPQPTQAGLYEVEGEEETDTAVAVEPKKKEAWPKTIPDQVRAVRAVVAALGVPVGRDEVARCFTRARTDRVGELLETLAAMGQIVELEDGRFTFNK
jgi:hypothetical protein